MHAYGFKANEILENNWVLDLRSIQNGWVLVQHYTIPVIIQSAPLEMISSVFQELACKISTQIVLAMTFSESYDGTP
jgi:hypothetical protein